MENEIWKSDSRKEWWRKKRLNYNIGLILSGILAFILYLIVVEFVVLKSEKIWHGELTIFTIFMQGIGYLILIGIANLFYYLGPISELLIKPKNAENYRILGYRFGYWFSCGIPLLVPVFLFIEYIWIRKSNR